MPVAGIFFVALHEVSWRWAAGRRGALGGFPLGEAGVEVDVEPFIVLEIPDGFPAEGDFGRGRANRWLKFLLR